MGRVIRSITRGSAIYPSTHTLLDELTCLLVEAQALLKIIFGRLSTTTPHYKITQFQLKTKQNISIEQVFDLKRQQTRAHRVQVIRKRKRPNPRMTLTQAGALSRIILKRLGRRTTKHYKIFR